MAVSKVLQKHDERKDLSKLPDDVINHIMSFLTQKDVSAVALVSKRWYAFIASFPCPPILDLNEYRFRKSLGLVYTNNRGLVYSNDYCKAAKEKFLDFVYESLVEYFRIKPYMGTIKLDCCYEIDTSRIDSLIEFAVKNNIGELHLRYRHPSPPYKLPPVLISSKTLTRLHLRWCVTDDHILAGNTILDSFQELYLEDFRLLSPNNLSLFVSKCPSLRSLTLESCNSSRIINISHAKLKKIRVADYFGGVKIKIEAQNLQKFSYSHHGKNPSEVDLYNCENLELLDLDCEVSPSGISENICSGFLHLRTLRLRLCGAMMRLKILSESLESFSLLQMESLMDTEFNAPNVQSFECDTETIMRAASVIASSSSQYMFGGFTYFVPSSQQWIMAERRVKISTLDTLWFLTLRSLLGKLSQNVDLSLHIDKCEVKFDEDELEGLVIPPFCNVKHLKLGVFTPKSFFQEKYIRLIDGLLWSCHPVKISTSGNKIFRKVLYRDLRNRDRKQNCCGSTHIRCWRHFLKCFEIEQFEKVNNEIFVSFKLKW